MIGVFKRQGAFPGLSVELQRILGALEMAILNFARSVRENARTRWVFGCAIITSTDSPYLAQVGEFVLVDTTAAAVTVQLPEPTTDNLGYEIAWQDAGAGANTLTLAPVYKQIDGAASVSAGISGHVISCGPTYGWRTV